MSNGEAGRTGVLEGTLDLMILQTLHTLGAQWDRTAALMRAVLDGRAGDA